MGLRIRLLEGGRRRTARFGDRVDGIVLGRSRRCHVRFSRRPEVALEHCALERVLGRYRLVVSGDAPVFVDGELGVDGEELPSVFELRLGSAGPRLSVAMTGPAPSPIRAVGRGIRSVVHGVRTNRLLLVLALLVASIGLTGGVLARADARRGRDAAEAATRRVSELSSEVARDRLDGEDADVRLVRALERARASVYRTVIRRADGLEVEGATAWVVAPATLATNAHVAQQFRYLRAGETFWVRSSGPEPRSHRVIAAEIHPGYVEFGAVWRRHGPGSPSAGACDVALLRVAPRTDLGEPLALASPSELLELREGQPIGSVGYPAEDMVFGGSPIQDPVPQVQFGRITALTTFLGTRGLPDTRYLVQHSCPGTGGSSGSPLIDADGRVVALDNAGNFSAGARGRTPSAVAINFAQRVDLLRELLDGTAVPNQVRRTARWQSALEELYGTQRLRWARLRRADRLWTDEWVASEKGGFAELTKWTFVTERSSRSHPTTPDTALQQRVFLHAPGAYRIYLVDFMRPAARIHATWVPAKGTPQAVDAGTADQGFLAHETSGPGDFRLFATTDGLPRAVTFLVFHAETQPLTKELLRDELAHRWRSQLERTSATRYLIETVATRTHLRSWSGTLPVEAGGQYYVVVSAGPGAECSLTVDGVAGRRTTLIERRYQEEHLVPRSSGDVTIRVTIHGGPGTVSVVRAVPLPEQLR